ncbi:hypothetical protein [Azospirillum argentinense]|uniref:DUF4376 domain-containing protein n=1 Tax=Azospirillum argentinense TaxID=2970906 RepID=UPI0032DF0B96
MDQLISFDGAYPVPVPVRPGDPSKTPVWPLGDKQLTGRDALEAMRASGGTLVGPKPPDGASRKWIWSPAGSAWVEVAKTADDLAAEAEARREALLEAAEGELARRLGADYRHDFGAPVGVKGLQARPADLINWLSVAAACQSAIIAGQPETPVTIRLADNDEVTQGAAETLAVLTAMQTFLSAVYAASWALKDHIRTCPAPELDAVDVTAGVAMRPWPAPA